MLDVNTAPAHRTPPTTGINPAFIKAGEKEAYVRDMTQAVQACTNVSADKVIYRTALGKVLKIFTMLESAGYVALGDLPRDTAEKLWSMRNAIKPTLAYYHAGKFNEAVEAYRKALVSGVIPVALTALPDDLVSLIDSAAGRKPFSLRAGIYSAATLH